MRALVLKVSEISRIAVQSAGKTVNEIIRKTSFLLMGSTRIKIQMAEPAVANIKTLGKLSRYVDNDFAFTLR